MSSLTHDLLYEDLEYRTPLPRYGWVRRHVVFFTPQAMAAVFAVLYAVVSLRRFANWQASSYDNAIFEQAIKGYAHLRAPIVDIKGVGFNILGDHFSPITALLAPIYRLFPDARTLLIAQVVLVAVSVIPICRAGIHVLGRGAGMCLGAAYGLSFGIQSAIDVDFHEVAFAAVLLAFAGEAFLRRRWTALTWWMLPLLLVKEDLGLTVAGAGAVLLLRNTHRSGHFADARRPGLLLLVAGLTGFIATVFWIIPSFNPTDSFAYWGAVGFSPDGPSFVETFFAGWDIKYLTVLLTLGVTGFLALRSPWVLLAVPTLAWRFAEVRDTYWGTQWHYSLVLMPTVFTALIDAHLQLGVTGRRWLRSYASHVPAIALTLALVITPQFPLGKLLKAETYRIAERADAAKNAVALMTPGSTVETNLDMITHLVSGFHVYWIGADIPPDYLAIGNDNPDYDVAADAEARHPGNRYTTLYAAEGYFIAARIGG